MQRKCAHCPPRPAGSAVCISLARSFPCTVPEGPRSPTGRAEATSGAHFQTVLHLMPRALTLQVLLTLNILKNRQKASSEEGKYLFSDRFSGGCRVGRRMFSGPRRLFLPCVPGEGQALGSVV